MSAASFQTPGSATPPGTSPEAQAAQKGAFAPLPLRPRGVLELLDLAVKVFKQFWRPLLAWAALSNALNWIPGINYVTIFLSPPLLVGAVCCCLAAAVRGQAVGFRACWSFIKPRFWNVVAMHVLSGICAAIALVLAGVVLGVAFGLLTAQLGSFSEAGVIIIVLAALLFLLVFSVVATAVGAWHSLVSVAACMEDDSRNTRSFKRAWELLRGRWKPAINLLMALGLGALVLWGILGGGLGILVGFGSIGDALSGGDTDSSWIGVLAGFFLSSWLLFTLYMPIHYLSVALLYLDLRIRKEALDLEWNSYLGNAPATSTAAPTLAPASPMAHSGSAHEISLSSASPTTGIPSAEPTSATSPLTAPTRTWEPSPPSELAPDAPQSHVEER